MIWSDSRAQSHSKGRGYPTLPKPFTDTIPHLCRDFFSITPGLRCSYGSYYLLCVTFFYLFLTLEVCNIEHSRLPPFLYVRNPLFGGLCGKYGKLTKNVVSTLTKLRIFDEGMMSCIFFFQCAFKMSIEVDLPTEVNDKNCHRNQ